MIFVGVDPSIVCTGIVAIMDGEVVWERTVDDPPRKKGEPKKGTRVDPVRLANMVRRVLECFPGPWSKEEHTDVFVAIEEPFIGKNATAALKTYSVFAALVFEVQMIINYQNGIVGLLTPSPANIKKFVGVKEKNFVARAVFRKWGYAADDDNLVDAYAIARWAEAEWNATYK